MQVIRSNYSLTQRLYRRAGSFLFALLCAGSATQAQVATPGCTLPGYVSSSVFLPASSTNVYPQQIIADNAGNTFLSMRFSMTAGTTYLDLTRGATADKQAAITKISPDGTVKWNRWTVAPGLTYVLSGACLYGYGLVANMSVVPGISGTMASYTNTGYIVTKIDTATGANLGVYALERGVDCTNMSIQIKNGAIYYAMTTASAALTVTDGSALMGGQSQFAAKRNSDGTLAYAGYVSAMAPGDFVAAVAVAHDGTLGIRTVNSLIRLDAAGNLVFNVASAQAFRILTDGTAYYSLGSGSSEVRCIKTDLAGNEVYNKQVFNESVSFSDIRLQGNYIYFLSTSSGGGPWGNLGEIVKIDKNTGAVVYSFKFPNYFLESGPHWDLDEHGNVWVTYASGVTGYGPMGNIIFSGTIAGSSSTDNYIAAGNGKVFVTTTTTAANYPFTRGMGSNGPVWTAFDFNPDLAAAPDTITSSVSIICKSGAGAMLTGNKVDLSLAANVPLLYRSGKSETQTGNLTYQWQQSADSISWTNIGGATAQNYLPAATGSTMFYRRQVTSGNGCSKILSTSNAIKISVNAFTAPTAVSAVPSGYSTCPGTAVNVALNITGGLPPYIVNWDNTTGTLSSMSVSGTPATATATPTQPTVYTATIADANGCIQYGQASVMTYSLGANKASFKCASDSALIGRPSVAPGASDISYAWTPVAGLACPACPQTRVLNTGVYTQTLTVNITGGGTCTSTMQDTVKSVSPPSAGFAGPDFVLCSPANGGTNLVAAIGASSSPGTGYTYTWSPGNYLTANSGFQTSVRLGSVLPVPNPLSYFVTATLNGCRFVDTMTVSVLRADAGIDGCGPRMIGNRIDPTPAIKGKTYSWTRIDNGAGAASFQVSTDTSRMVTLVTAGTIDTRFAVTVKDAAGNICSDTVLVTADCGCINSRIDVLNPLGCPQYVDAATPVRLKVYMGVTYTNDNLVYDWSPKMGLDRYDSSVVTLTDGVPRTYTVQIKDRNTDAVYCTVTKAVNGIGWSFPAFNVKDTLLCPVSGSAAKLINIGRPAIAGYSYKWTGSGLSADNVANPAITINSAFNSSSYEVQVTDNGSGCITTEHFTVSVTPVVANAGPDQLICGSALVTLAGGVDSLANYTYSWTPSSDWQEGTDSSTLHARVAVATDIDYVLKATNLLSGCSATDTAHMQVTAPVALTISSAKSTICKGASLDLSVPLYGAAQYTWTSSNPAEVLPAATAGLNKITVTPLQTTAYTVSISYGAVCTDITGSKTITVTDLNYIPSLHTGYCPSTNPATIVLGPAAAPASGTGPYTYNWQPAALVNTPTARTTTVKVAPKVNTDYQLTITDATGCAATTTETVTVVPGSQPKAGNSATICLGSTATLGDAANAGVIWAAAAAPASVSQLSSTTAATPVFTPTAAGTYKFYVRYTSGTCVNPDTVIITVRANPALSVPGVTMCSGTGSYASIGTTALAGLSYQWSPVTGLDNPNAATTVVHAAASAVYTLTATDASGCQASVDVPVVVSSGVAPVVFVPALSYCIDHGSGQFMTAVNGAAPAGNYTAAWTPATYLSSATDIRPYVYSIDTGKYNYSVIVTDQSTGCAVQAPATATVTDCSDNIVTLAIKLLSFKAAPQNRQALLSWITAPDQSAAFFEVQSSVDGSSWQQIGKVSAVNDRSRNNVNYSFVDEAPQANAVYYRLKMVELNSTYEFSMVRPVRFGNAAANSQISWYPNPSKGQIIVKTQDVISEVRVADLSGRIVFRQSNVTDGAVLNLDQTLGAGMYIISFEQNGQVQADKLMLSK